MNQHSMTKGNTPYQQKIPAPSLSWLAQGHIGIGLLLALALIAFELFNFDTTQYALVNLLGDIHFAGLRWATILAIAFCAIDFAGLSRFFIPNNDNGAHGEVWYLIGAWLLAATMNALMTWWAVSLTLLNHEIGNEVLGRAQLIEIVPIFVAVLVWLTRILFIGSLSAAGERLFKQKGERLFKPKAAGERQQNQARAMPRHRQPLRAQPGGTQPVGAQQGRRNPVTEGTVASNREEIQPIQPIVVSQVEKTFGEPIAGAIGQTEVNRRVRAQARMQGRGQGRQS